MRAPIGCQGCGSNLFVVVDDKLRCSLCGRVTEPPADSSPEERIWLPGPEPTDTS